MEGQIQIPERLKNIRETRGFTQKSLSVSLDKNGFPGISARKIQSWEAKSEDGNRGINSEDLRDLACFYGVTTDYLLGLSETETPPESAHPCDISTEIAKEVFTDDKRAIEHLDNLLWNIRNTIINAERICMSYCAINSSVIEYYYFCNALLFSIIGENKEFDETLRNLLDGMRDYFCTLFSDNISEKRKNIILQKANQYDLSKDINTVCKIANRT